MICLGGANHDPSSWLLEELSDMAPSRALDPDRQLPELGTKQKQGNCQVCYDRRGGPRTLSKKADANLDCAFVENGLVYSYP